MATVTFAGLGESFSLSEARVSYEALVIEVAPEVWSYASSTDDWAVFRSTASDLQYSGFNPLSGTVTSFEFWRGAGLLHDLQFSITGLSLDFATLAPLGSLSEDEQNNLVWRLLLGGDDTIDLGTSGTDDITFAGDGRNVESGQSLSGGKDTITGSVGPSYTHIDGDYLTVSTGGMAFGGGDTINVDSGLIDGDAYSVETGAFLQGGNDTLSRPGFRAGNFIIGDASYSSGTVIGGNDTIEATFNGTGDVYSMSGGFVVGGDDSITAASGFSTELIGDIQLVSGGVAQGGNDTITGGALGDVIWGDFDQVTGGVAHGGNDLISGGGGEDVVYANGGNDTIEGGADKDALNGQDGNDLFRYTAVGDLVSGETINGGNGTDRLYLSDAAGYDFNLSQASLTSIEAIEYGSPAATMTTVLLAAEQFGSGVSLKAAIIGTAGAVNENHLVVAMGTVTNLDLSDLVFTNFSDTGEYVVIVGDNDAETITGTDVDDSISGGGGADVLYGGDGDDTIDGGFQKDTSYGGAGNDTFRQIEGNVGSDIYGGADVDTLDLSLWTNPAVSFTVDLAAETYALLPNDFGANGSYVLQEVENVVGSSFNDTVTGDTAANSIDGGNGSDTLLGGAGKDTLRGGAGDDVLRVFESHGLESGEIYDGGGGTGDILYIDNDPASYGDYDLNFGTVSLTGFEELEMYSQNDGIGNAFNATARFKSSQFGPGLSLTATIDVINNELPAADRIVVAMDTNSLNLSGLNFTTGSFGEATDYFTITGTTSGNTITGSKVRDSISGGSGNDTLKGGTGNDTLNGGSSTDTADYADKTTKVTIVLDNNGDGTATIGGEVDTLDSIENAIGGSAGDSFTGANDASSLSGGGGNDTFRGGTGNDTLNGGSSTDTADYSDKTAKVTIVLDNNGDGTATIGGEVDTLDSIENAIGGSAGDSFTGANDASSLSGGGGNDTFRGGTGNDTLNGGADNDTADYSDQSVAVVVTLNNDGDGTATIGGEVDTLDSIERLIGGSKADSFTGGDDANRFSGGGGSDTLVGGLGNDILTGGSGADHFRFNTAPNSTTNVDHITDFAAGDKISIENAIFAVGSAIDAADFISKAGHVFTTTSQRLIYDQTAHELWYDANGSAAGGGGAIKVAIFDNSPAKLLISDFAVV